MVVLVKYRRLATREQRLKISLLVLRQCRQHNLGGLRAFNCLGRQLTSEGPIWYDDR
jgi:hypothetical protein